MNLYCSRIDSSADHADYAVGCSVCCLDGIVRFYCDDRAPEILREWTEYPIALYGVYFVNKKHRSRLSQRDFPERMSREIG